LGWCFPLTSACPAGETTTVAPQDFVKLAAHYIEALGLGCDFKVTLKGGTADSPWFVMSTPTNSAVGLKGAS